MSEHPSTEPLHGEPSDAVSTDVVDATGTPEHPITEGHGRTDGFLPPEPTRKPPESILVRVIATAGVTGIGTALGAILVAADVAGWIVGLAVSVLTVVLAALLWRSRTL